MFFHSIEGDFQLFKGRIEIEAITVKNATKCYN